MFEYDKHYRECQQLNKPFIKAKINPAHQYYFVQVDLMTCSYKLSLQEQEEIKQLVNDEIIFSKSKFYDFNIDKELAWFDGISPDRVDRFCESLYDLIQKYHN